MWSVDEIPIDRMYRSMEAYENSPEYKKESTEIAVLIEALRTGLNEAERKLLTEILDRINECDYLYAEEAYACGVRSARKNEE